MSLRFIAFAGVFIFLWPAISGAQETEEISGIVLNDSTKFPLENVDVLVKELGIGSKTDANGFYKITKIIPGEYTLRFSHISFLPLEKKIRIKPGEIRPIQVTLKKDIKELGEVVVEDFSTQKIISKMPYVVTPFSASQIQESVSGGVAEFLRSSKILMAFVKGELNSILLSEVLSSAS
ncbi:MAG: carboxypeptidase-like regulatory domain-containing protein [Bacteroidales bacterium]